MIDQNNFDFKSFEKPWHGQIFAITVSLSENKVFKWSEFSKVLADQIKMDKTEKQNGDFGAWGGEASPEPRNQRQIGQLTSVTMVECRA